MSSSDALGTVCSDSASYCSHLLRQGRGFPLYVPGPQRNLPEEYRQNGVMIGDVGRVTPEGVFDFFFNIYLDADDPVHANFVPEDFRPLQRYIPRDIVYLEFDPGNYVASAFVQAWDPNGLSDEFPGSEFLFSCMGPSGALLALPHGAQLEKLEDVEHVRQYAACNAESWYKYINGTRGRALTNGSLYLITGCEKSRSGGMGSFQNVTPGAEFQLSFRPTTSADSDYKYRFTRGNPARTKHFDGSGHNDQRPLNQTTFLHGFSISLGEGIWGRLFGVKVREITDSQMEGSQSDFVPFGLQGSLFSWSFNFLSGGGGAGGKKYTDHTGEGVTLSNFSPTSVVVHPGQLINNFLLGKRPEAKVVITHDDDWRDVLRDDGTEAAIKETTELLERIFEQSAVKEKNGVIFLVSKSEQLSLPPLLPWFPSVENSSRASELSAYDFHAIREKGLPMRRIERSAESAPQHPSRRFFTQSSVSSVMDLDCPELEAVSSSSTAPSHYDLGHFDQLSNLQFNPLPPDKSFFVPHGSIPAAPSHYELGHDDQPSHYQPFIDESLLQGQFSNSPWPDLNLRAAPSHRAPPVDVTLRAASLRHDRSKRGKFVCPLCGSEFTAKHNLKNHVNSHDSTKEFKCEDCGQSFGTAHVLKRHRDKCGKPKVLAQSIPEGHEMEV
ncbi:hypothetical protein C8F04DRAFT_1150029 [Mycena alexandri]|uniref:C2H2-type domain-containing protein n=1 Tax=Mycena alexandri TaxID=1745969 RepID=A0AAD6WS13_9AGAR|nr:hypothetical protein C8F04DRAFT_1150029 [Mycena alexandri]